MNPDQGTRKHNFFVKLEKGRVVGFDNSPLRWRTNSGERPTDEWLKSQEPAYYGWVETKPPVIDPATHKRVEEKLTSLNPDHENGTVTQKWRKVKLTPEEVEEHTRRMREAVNVQRDIRMNDPVKVVLSDDKTFRVDIGGDSRNNIALLTSTALAKKAINNIDPISFRDADNNDWDLSNEDIIEMSILVSKHIEDLHIKARNIKEKDPIPSNFSDDIYWK